MNRPAMLLSLFSAGLLFISCLAGTAVADPTGTTYQLMVQNFFTDAGPEDVVFDAAQQVVGGVSVMEMATELPDGNELLEFWIEKDQAPLSEDPTVGFGFWIQGLHWLDAAGKPVQGRVIPDSAFIYFTIDGVPVEEFGGAAPHPVDSNIPVIPLTGDFGDEFSDLIDIHLTSAPLGDFLEIIGPGLGLLERVNDAHFGFVVEHVPEPGTLTLAALCGLSLIGVVRRRR